jgi:geranylgeranyl reductase family protein
VGGLEVVWAVSEVFDLAVVGAGPAGSAAALAALRARPQASVLLLDASTFPRDKTCGDGIAAGVFDELAALEVTEPATLGRRVPVLQVRSPRGRGVAETCARANRVVPRAEFDAALVAAATERGAVLAHRRVRHLRQDRDHVVLDGEIAAVTVVGADGANSTVRRALGAPRRTPQTMALAVRGYTHHPPVAPEARVIAFTRAHGPAYAWCFPLACGGANVGYDAFGQHTGITKTELCDRLAETFPEQAPDPGTVRGHLLPLSTGGRFCPDGRVLLAGDAAGLVNPITGEGIYDAVTSGVLAGHACARGPLAGRCYRAWMRRTFARHHRHTTALAHLMPDPRFIDAAVTAAARHRGVFGTVVDVGLGRGHATPATLAILAGTYLTTRPG